MSGGYVYVIEFSNGVIKVGRTQNPEGRLSAHRGNARKFGAQVTNSWVSPLHEDWRENEHRLIGIAWALGGEVRGEEYFTGAAFDAMVRGASALRFTPPSPEALRERREDMLLGALFPEAPATLPGPEAPARIASMTGPELDLAANALYGRQACEGADEWELREWNAIANLYELIRPLLKDSLTVFQAVEQFIAEPTAPKAGKAA